MSALRRRGSSLRRLSSGTVASYETQRECWNCGHNMDESKRICPDCGESEDNGPQWWPDDLNAQIQVEELPRGVADPINLAMLDLEDEEDEEYPDLGDERDDNYPDDEEDEDL